MTLFDVRSAVLLGLAIVPQSPSVAQQSSGSAAERSYVRQVLAYESMFNFRHFRDTTPNSPYVHFGDTALKVEQRAVKDLERKLRPIVGPFTVSGFSQPGAANNDDLFDEEGFDQMDGIRYSIDSHSANREETTVVVTTAPILRAWLRRQTGIDPRLSIDVAFARHADLLSGVFEAYAAAVPYAQIPRDTLRALGLSWGWIGNFEQDDHRVAARRALFMVERGRQIVLVDLELARPIDPPPTCLDANLPTRDNQETWGGNFRACYARSVLRDPRFGAIVGQIREMADRIRRQ